MPFCPLLRLVVIVSEEPFLFNVALLAVEVVLPDFLWSPAISMALLMPLTEILLLVLASSPAETSDSEADPCTLSTGDGGTSGSRCCFLSIFFPGVFSFSAPETADLLSPPPLAAVFFLVIDTVDFRLGVMEAGLLVDAGLSFFGSSTGTGGLFVGVAPATPLFVEPAEDFLARTPGAAPPAAPGRVGVTRPVDSPIDARALLTFETVEFADVFLDLVPVPTPTKELAVRKVSLVVEALIPEMVREEANEDIVEVREAAPRVLGDVTVLLRIVDAWE